MEAVDYKYRYRFEKPEGVTWDMWDKVRAKVWNIRNEAFEASGLEPSDYEENIQHVVIQEICKQLGIKSYTRWRNG